MTVNKKSNKGNDLLKWLSIGLILLIAGALNYYYYDKPLTYRLIAVIIFALAIFMIFLKTGKGKSAIVFFDEVVLELRKVFWPSKQEVTQMSFIVFVVVVIVGLIIWFMDSVYLWAIKLITQG